MKESWRWFGHFDAITLREIAQTGATGIVTALHEIPYGEVWPRAAIAARHAEIKSAGFRWDVVESLPIHERIKRGEGDLAPLFANYRQSMANLAAEGVTRICYNFMPLLDWTRTDLAAPVARGGTCLRFSAPRMAAFELHMLGRNAESDYSGAGPRRRRRLVPGGERGGSRRIAQGDHVRPAGCLRPLRYRRAAYRPRTL